MTTSNRWFAGAVAALVIAFAQGGSAASVVAPFQPPQGYLFSKQKAPLQLNKLQNVNTQQSHGKSTCMGFLQYYTLWFAWGDSSVEAAARQGGLARVDYADYEYLSIFNGFFNITTVHVYGPHK